MGEAHRKWCALGCFNMPEYISGAEPLYEKRGPVGCLLLHGFTGAVHEMRHIAAYLTERDITVHAPCMAGHGTSPEDLNTTRWPDWYRSAREALDRIKSECSTVFVAGLSMGGLQTLHIATHDRDVRGFIAYAGPVFVRNWKLSLFGPLMRHTPIIKIYRYDKGIGDDIADPEAIKTHISYKKTPTACVLSLLEYMRHVREDLAEISAPLLIMQSRQDHTVHPENANVIYNEVSSKDKEIIWFDKSYHVITVDYDKQAVCEKTYEFIQKRL